MRAKFLKQIDQFRSSFWMIPLAMCLAAIISASLFLQLDAHSAAHKWFGIDWLFNRDPDGARATLTTISSTMMGTAGVVFSIVIVVLSLASSQFGPRLPRSFMHDRVNQYTLGTFVSSFLYCLLILGEIDQSVPPISLAVALVLAIVNIWVLIWFIHHTARLIQAPQVIENVGREMDETLERLFPSQDEDKPSYTGELDHLLTHFSKNADTICATASGYVQTLGFSALFELASSKNLCIRLLVRPGDFILERQRVAQVMGEGDYEIDSMSSSINNQIILGNARTPIQDLSHAIDQLQEIALRALSPGINDPFSAINAIDRIGVGLSALCSRQAQRSVIVDAELNPRLITRRISRVEIIESAFSPLRNHAVDHIPVCQRLIEMAGAVASLTREAHLREALLRQAELMKNTVAGSDAPKHDREHLEKAWQVMMASFDESRMDTNSQ